MRRSLVLIAVLGVLAHAWALVTHHTTMLSNTVAASSGLGSKPPASPPAATQAQLIGALMDMSAICLNGAPSPADLPDGELPSHGNGSTCPVCAGMTSVAVLVPEIDLPSVRFAVVGELEFVFDLRIAQLKRLRPQGRGPPSIA